MNCIDMYKMSVSADNEIRPRLGFNFFHCSLLHEIGAMMAKLCNLFKDLSKVKSEFKSVPLQICLEKKENAKFDKYFMLQLKTDF